MTTLFDCSQIVKPTSFGRGVLRSTPTYRTEVSSEDREWLIQDNARRDAEAQADRRARPARQPVPNTIVRIKDRSYSVEPIPTPADVNVRVVALTKADGTVYHVSQHPYGCECTCPDFVFKRDGIDPKGCKHVKAIVSAGCFA